MHTSQSPPTLQDATGEIFNAATQEIIDCCLNKNPADRYSSTTDLVSDLERIGTAFSSPMLHTSIPVHTTRRRKKKPIIVILATTSLAVLCGITYWYSVVEPEENAKEEKEKRKAARAKLDKARFVPRSRPFRFNALYAGDSDLQAFLEGHSDLEYLNMIRCNVSEVSLKYLKNTNLKQLSLEHVPLTQPAIHALSQSKTLQQLSIVSSDPLYYEGLVELNNIESFSSLQITAGKDIDYKKMSAIGRLTKLKKLKLKGCLVEPGATKALEGMPNLEYLNLDGSEVKDQDMDFITKLPALKEINLAFTLIEGPTLKKLATIKTLQKATFCVIGGPPKSEIEEFGRERPDIEIVSGQTFPLTNDEE